MVAALIAPEGWSYISNIFALFVDQILSANKDRYMAWWSLISPYICYPVTSILLQVFGNLPIDLWISDPSPLSLIVGSFTSEYSSIGYVCEKSIEPPLGAILLDIDCLQNWSSLLSFQQIVQTSSHVAQNHVLESHRWSTLFLFRSSIDIGKYQLSS